MDNRESMLSGRAETARSDYENKDAEKTSTTSAYLLNGSLMLLIFAVCAAFWGVSRKTPLVFSLSSTRAVEESPKTFTFVWTLLGTILAFTTGTLFNQLLKTSIQQNVAAYGLKIGLLEFSSRLYARKWLNDHRPERFLLSLFTIVFAVAFGLLVSAYTGLLTPTRVYLEGGFYASEVDYTSAAFTAWMDTKGVNVTEACDGLNTYGSGDKAVTLPKCPQVKDPVSYVSAGLAAIEVKYAEYNPTTSVLGVSFNGTTKGVLPRGFNTIPYFDTAAKADLPPVPEYNYSIIQQGLSASVVCTDTGTKSNVTWLTQGEELFTQRNGNVEQEIFIQNFTYNPTGESNLLVSGNNMISAFYEAYGDDYEITRVDIASYGSYAMDWKFPNMSCLVKPYLTTVNVTFSNMTGLFTADIVSVSDYQLTWPSYITQVIVWELRQFTIPIGNHILNSIIALQNTPSYQREVSSNVTIAWLETMELFMEGLIEFHSTRLRMVLEAEINSTNVEPSGFKPIAGVVSSWRLGYNGASGSVVILFPLMGFTLLVSGTVVGLGLRTGVSHVSKFDPLNTTHIIIASALGGRRGQLRTLNGEQPTHAHDKALNLRVNYDGQSFQEVDYANSRGYNPRGYTELSNLQGVELDEPPPTSSGLLNVRKPFVRTTTG